MSANPALAIKAVRSALKHLDAELYDENIAFEDTARRVLSLTDAAAHAVVAAVISHQLPSEPANLLAKAVQAVHRRDLLAARDFILDALNCSPAGNRKI